MVMLSHFKAWGYFCSLSPNKLLDQAVALASSLLEALPSLQPFFLIQRPSSLCCTTRLFLTTSIFPSSFLSIPFDGCVKFIGTVTSVIMDCSEWDTAFTPRGCDLQVGPSEWNVTWSRLGCSVFECRFIIPNKNKFRLLKSDIFFSPTNFRLCNTKVAKF